MSTQLRPKFMTTRINNILYRASHLLIVSTYIMYIAIMLRQLPDRPNWIVQGWVVQVVVGIPFLTPVFLRIMNYFYWIPRVAFSVVCVLIFLIGSFWGLSKTVATVPSFLQLFSTPGHLILFAFIIIGILAYLFHYKQGQEPYWDMGLKNRIILNIFSLVSLVFFGLLPLLGISGEDLVHRMQEIVGVIFLIKVVQGLRKSSSWNYWGFLSLTGFIMFVLLHWALHLSVSTIPSPILNLIGPVGLILMILAYDVEIYLSRLRSQWRQLTAAIRHDRIRRRMSPTLYPNNLMDRSWHTITRRLRTASPLVVLLVIFVGAFIIANILDILWLTNENKQPSALPALQLGFYAGATFTGLYLIWWFITHRQKHIVTPFAAQPDGLGTLAISATNAFTAELQRIGQLLHNRQVENVDAADRVGLAMFVTSGQEDEQIGALANLEFSPDVKLSAGNLFTLIGLTLARTRVRGRVQQTHDNKVEIHIEIAIRGSLAVSVDRVIPLESGQIAEQSMQNEMSELAMKLIYKTGIVGHLSSNFESFQVFVKGLEASSDENWWLAITHYRRCINIEKTARGAFGLGDYHLGAALVSQGELRDGLEHLEKAIHSGPPLAETHYMWAFTQLYLSADKLLDGKVAHRIVNECETALELRPFFPEVHFLLGLTYYKQAQINEKRSTRIGEVIIHGRGGNNPNSNADKDEDNRATIDDYMSIYHNARKHLKIAIQQYDRLIPRLSKQQASRESARREQARLMRDRMAATHRLADTLRSLQLYSEADSHYDDVIEAYPTDLRTLTDRAKTYCQAQNWDRAIHYNWERLMSHPVARWDAVPNLCLGWAITGGITTREPQRRFVRRWLLGAKDDPGVASYERSKRAFEMAVEVMDYALLVRPRRVLRWQQTNWLPYFVKAAYILQEETIWNEFQSYAGGFRSWLSNVFRRLKPIVRVRSLKTFRHWLRWDSYIEFEDIIKYFSGLQSYDDPQTPFNQLRWLIWRGATFDVNWEGISQTKQPHHFNTISLDTNVPNHTPWIRKYKDLLQKHRSRVVTLLEQNDKDQQLENPTPLKERLRLEVADLYSNWESMDKDLKLLTSDTPARSAASPMMHNSFAVRMEIDIYLEFTILTVRVLCDVRAFAIASKVAQQGFERIKKQLMDKSIRLLTKQQVRTSRSTQT